MAFSFFKSGVLVAALLLAACGGSSESKDTDNGTANNSTSNNENNTSTDTGGNNNTLVEYKVTVIDGYIRYALAYVDINANGTLEPGEPFAVTGAGGVATLDLTGLDLNLDTLQISVLVPDGAIDESTITEDNPNGTPIPVGQSFVMITLPGEAYATPLTTLVATLAAQTGDFEAAKALVAKELNIQISDIGADFIANQNAKLAALAELMVKAGVLNTENLTLVDSVEAHTSLAIVKHIHAQVIESIANNTLAEDSARILATTELLTLATEEPTNNDELTAEEQIEQVDSVIETIINTVIDGLETDEINDLDGDNIVNREDDDIDGDGVINETDDHPYDNSIVSEITKGYATQVLTSTESIIADEQSTYSAQTNGFFVIKHVPSEGDSHYQQFFAKEFAELGVEKIYHLEQLSTGEVIVAGVYSDATSGTTAEATTKPFIMVVGQVDGQYQILNIDTTISSNANESLATNNHAIEILLLSADEQYAYATYTDYTSVYLVSYKIEPDYSFTLINSVDMSQAGVFELEKGMALSKTGDFIYYTSMSGGRTTEQSGEPTVTRAAISPQNGAIGAIKSQALGANPDYKNLLISQAANNHMILATDKSLQVMSINADNGELTKVSQLELSEGFKPIYLSANSSGNKIAVIFGNGNSDVSIQVFTLSQDDSLVADSKVPVADFGVSIQWISETELVTVGLNSGMAIKATTGNSTAELTKLGLPFSSHVFDVTPMNQGYWTTRNGFGYTYVSLGNEITPFKVAHSVIASEAYSQVSSYYSDVLSNGDVIIPSRGLLSDSGNVGSKVSRVSIDETSMTLTSDDLISVQSNMHFYQAWALTQGRFITLVFKLGESQLGYYLQLYRSSNNATAELLSELKFSSVNVIYGKSLILFNDNEVQIGSLRLSLADDTILEVEAEFTKQWRFQNGTISIDMSEVKSILSINDSHFASLEGVSDVESKISVNKIDIDGTVTAIFELSLSHNSKSASLKLSQDGTKLWYIDTAEQKQVFILDIPSLD